VTATMKPTGSSEVTRSTATWRVVKADRTEK
jgi:hypothetical protein